MCFRKRGFDMRANTNINLKPRNQMQLNDFKGVDFSSSPLRVQSNRASNMSNFINEYGVNKKRNGWNELFKIEINRVPQQINGIFWYVNRDHKEMLVHAGKRFYRVKQLEDGSYIPEDITLSSTYEPAKCDISKLKNQRSQMFTNKGKAYIIGCGDYLVYGSWDNGKSYELRRVANNIDTYIPTTTISIDNDKVTDDTRGSLDDVNCLSSKRINQLLGSSEKNITWTLDSGSIDTNTEVFITLETKNEDDELITLDISNSKDDKTALYDGDRQVGSIDYEKGKITFSIATTPQIENRDNIFVTFEHAVEGYAERIANCNFGILFGVNGNTDRLFLSGNPDYPNVDFHSEMDDYTYFGDLNTSSMGSDSVAINGFARLSDSTLVIYKEENGQEASIFYRTGVYQESYDSLGNLDSVRAVFPTSAGSIGEGVVSRYACVNFGGDNIILSKNGVFGIVLANNVATTERYTRERSRSINEKLKKHKDLSEAVGIVFKSRYFLAVDDVCYIADSRFKYTSEENLDNSYNYEWWFWENVPVRVWANIENNLYFGSKEGQVCVFDDQYVDRTYQTSEVGDLALDVANNKIFYNENIDIGLKENDRVTFLTNGVYALYVDNIELFDDKLYVTEDIILSMYNGIEVYADNVGSSGLKLGEPYYLFGVDKGLCCFQLIDKNSNIINIVSGGFRLHRLISNKELYIANVYNDSFQLKDYKTSEVLTLSVYNETVPFGLVSKFTHRENVVAKWYTPIFDFGTNESSKTLLKLTISTEPEVNGQLSFGYETRSIDKLLKAKGINVFSFENLSFENFSFDTGFASSYSVKVKERNFNFIIFRFISDNEYDCAINTFTISYKINKSNKGVK